MRHLRERRFLDHLASRVGDRVRLIPIDQVTHVVARDRATYAVAEATEHMLDTTIVELERKLEVAEADDLEEMALHLVAGLVRHCAHRPLHGGGRHFHHDGAYGRAEEIGCDEERRWDGAHAKSRGLALQARAQREDGGQRRSDPAIAIGRHLHR